MKTKKTPLYILITYILMQLSPIIFLKPIASIIQWLEPSITNDELSAQARSWTIFFTFFLGTLVTIFFILRDKNFFKNAFVGGKRFSTMGAIGWGVLGFFMILIGQSLAGLIETSLGITPGSENTAQLSAMAKAAPIAIISIIFFGPFLEEVVFRRVIFASLNQTTNFFIAASVSAIVFAIVHMDFSHIIIYATVGFITAFLYNKTKRLLTTIIAHTMLNGFVIIMNLNLDKIEKYLETLKSMQ